MKDIKFRNIYTGEIVSAYNFGLKNAKEQWKEQRQQGLIPEDSKDYKKFIKSEKEILIQNGYELLKDDEEWEII